MNAEHKTIRLCLKQLFIFWVYFIFRRVTCAMLILMRSKIWRNIMHIDGKQQRFLCVHESFDAQWKFPMRSSLVYNEFGVMPAGAGSQNK